MPVNKFKIVPDGTNKNLNVKLYSEWDLEDRDDAIDEYKNTGSPLRRRCGQGWQGCVSCCLA